jgi:hypothetical protein
MLSPHMVGRVGIEPTYFVFSKQHIILYVSYQNTRAEYYRLVRGVQLTRAMLPVTSQWALGSIHINQIVCRLQQSEDASFNVYYTQFRKNVKLFLFFSKKLSWPVSTTFYSGAAAFWSPNCGYGISNFLTKIISCQC